MNNKLEKLIKKLYASFIIAYENYQETYPTDKIYFTAWINLINSNRDVAFKQLIVALKQDNLFDKEAEETLFSYIFGENNDN